MVGPQVSVVICHLRGTLLFDCLTSLQRSVGVTWEAAVVTSENPQDFPEFPQVRYWWYTQGPAAKRNFGSAFTHAPLLVFLDDDATVTPYTLYQLWTFMQAHPRCGMQFCRIYNAERREELDDCGSWLTWTGFLYARAGDSMADRTDIEEIPRRCLASKSATCAIRRGAFRETGGFDETYFILGEETDLAWRVWLLGREVWYNPAAVSYHAFDTTRKRTTDHYTLERIHRRGAANYLSCLLTNLGILRLWLTLPWHLLAWSLAVGGFVLRGQPTRGWLILCGLGDSLGRLSAIFAKRRAVQIRRKISDRVLMRYVKRTPPWYYYPLRMYRYLRQGLHG